MSSQLVESGFVEARDTSTGRLLLWQLWAERAYPAPCLTLRSVMRTRHLQLKPGESMLVVLPRDRSCLWRAEPKMYEQSPVVQLVPVVA